MKTPQVIRLLIQMCYFTMYFFMHCYILHFFSILDSDATVSSENSEGEGPRERERDIVKK